jgi:hypothetical protein
VARERRAVTPDGRVWYVRRRWARRRAPWSRRARHPTSWADADEELDVEGGVIPPIEPFAYPSSGEDLHLLGELGFDLFHDARHAVAVLLGLLAVVVVAIGLLAAATVEHVVPFVAANARLLLGAVATVAVLLAVDRLSRPWFVELQRQGLADAPRRVWRVRGWRRSARLMDEVAAAVREGRIDHHHAAILFLRGDPGPPR